MELISYARMNYGFAQMRLHFKDINWRIFAFVGNQKII